MSDTLSLTRAAKLIGVTRANREIASLARKLDSGRLADSHARAGDQRDPALKSQIHFSLTERKSC